MVVAVCWCRTRVEILGCERVVVAVVQVARHCARRVQVKAYRALFDTWSRTSNEQKCVFENESQKRIPKLKTKTNIPAGVLRFAVVQR